MDFTITKCDLVDIISEIIRYLSHITLLHVLNCFIDSKDELFDINYLKIMLFTTIAIVMYHIIINKLLSSRRKKMKNICDEQNN